MNTTTSSAATAAEAKQEIEDSKGRTRRHSGRFNMAAIKREIAARFAEKNGGAKVTTENHGHWLEVSS